MNAKKCDRCGALYVPFEFQSIGEAWRYSILRDNHPYEESKVDLCNNCLFDLEKWMQKGGEE